MKNLFAKCSAALTLAYVTSMTAMASTEETKSVIEEVTDPVVDLIKSFLGPMLAIVGAIGTLYCVILGVKYAKAEEPQDREKAKSHLKNAVIGFLLIFVLMLALDLLLPAMTDWVSANADK